MYGFEADKHLFRCLVSSVDFVSEGRNSGKDGQQLQLLIQEANSLMTKPNFVSILCYAFERQDTKVVKCSWLHFGFTILDRSTIYGFNIVLILENLKKVLSWDYRSCVSI